ncbi:hypothetical protein ACGFZP_35030 [Kitasatospora sp. NPDC048239]|uniref:hypothetical protein n=1 Tax=Kitasatospora sp. NPDC048239 TaxID=3364046 RepID=UPI003710BA2C
MLGDKIGIQTTSETGRRVLATADGLHPVVEVSFEGTGTVLGVGVKEFVTYESQMRSDGTLFGEGQGVGMSERGETYSWHGSGIGRFTGPGGAVAWRGSVFFDSDAESFVQLNDTVGLFEYDTDGSGSGKVLIYEWK